MNLFYNMDANLELLNYEPINKNKMPIVPPDKPMTRREKLGLSAHNTEQRPVF